MRRLQICEKSTESDGFEIGFKLRHIPSHCHLYHAARATGHQFVLYYLIVPRQCTAEH